MIAALWTLVALAGEHHVVRPGETLASLAATPEERAKLRSLNHLGPAEEPAPGTVLLLDEAPGAPPEPSVVLLLFGTAWMEEPGRAATPLRVDQTVQPGTKVCTGADSFATLRLAVNTTTHQHDDINLLPETCVVVRALGSGADGHSTLIDLGQGSVSVRNAPSEINPGLVTVRTADAVASARGGGQRVHVERGATRAEALYNPMTIWGGGEALELSAGQGSRVVNGQAPSAPVTLLPPGTPISPGAGSVLRTPDFSWTPMAGALGYRVEIALDAEFAELVLLDESAIPLLAPTTLLVPYRAGGFYWRVSCVDRLGFIGLPSDPVPLRFPPGVSP